MYVCVCIYVQYVCVYALNWSTVVKTPGSKFYFVSGLTSQRSGYETKLLVLTKEIHKPSYLLYQHFRYPVKYLRCLPLHQRMGGLLPRKSQSHSSQD